MPKRLVPSILLIIYSFILVKMMILRDIPVIKIGHMIFNFGGPDANGQANFIPFLTIFSYLFGNKGLLIVGVNLIGNIVLLIPFGFLLSFVIKNITWKKSLAIAVVICLAIETTQVILHTGIFDIDDVLLNGLGVMIGYWVYKALSKSRKE